MKLHATSTPKASALLPTMPASLSRSALLQISTFAHHCKLPKHRLAYPLSPCPPPHSPHTHPPPTPLPTQIQASLSRQALLQIKPLPSHPPLPPPLPPHPPLLLPIMPASPAKYILLQTSSFLPLIAFQQNHSRYPIFKQAWGLCLGCTWWV